MFESSTKAKKKTIQAELRLTLKEETLAFDSTLGHALVFRESPDLLSFLENLYRFDKGVFIYQQISITGRSRE